MSVRTKRPPYNPAAAKTLRAKRATPPKGKKPPTQFVEKRIPMYTEAEESKQLAAVLELWLQYANLGTIKSVMVREFPGVSVWRVGELIRRVQREQREQHAEENKVARERAAAAAERTIARLESRIAQAEGPNGNGKSIGLYNTKLRYMQHLAEIRGSYAPREVTLNVNVQLGVAVQAVFAGLTAEEVGEILQEEKRKELLLAQVESRLLPEPSYPEGNAQ